MNNIGIMQGRLTKSRNDKIQFFPVENWEKEFELAAEIGFNCIEWVIDSADLEINPLFLASKRKAIKNLGEKYHIAIPAVCHDQLMETPLHSRDVSIQEMAVDILAQTMDACEDLGIPYIEIPLIGDSAIKDSNDRQHLITELANFDDKAKEYGISFVLETDLSPEANVSLMKRVNGLSVGLNFDMGNSAYWGFDPDLELAQIGPWIMNVHVKDCKPEVYTVPLGDGDVNFQKVFQHLKSHNYSGWFILQAAPAPPDEEVEISKQYLQFTRSQMQEYFYES